MNAKLGSVAKFIRGVTFKPGDVIPLGTPGSVHCMRTKNVQAELDTRDVWAIPGSLVKREDQFLQMGDLLISSANSWNLVGKACWVPPLESKTTFGGFISALRADPAKLDARYLFHWFTSDRTQATLRSFGQKTTNISNLNIGRCEDMEIPLPPLDEQRRIAAILDQAEELCAKRRAAVGLLNQLPQAIFLEMFGDPTSNPMGWSVRDLKDVVREGTIVTYGIVQAGEEYPGGVPYIRTGDIVDGAIKLTGLRHTNPVIASKFQRSRVETGDIVMSIRATVGTVAVVPDLLDGANLTQGTARISPGSSTNPDYLYQFLRSSATQRWLSLQVKGATFREITLGRLRQLPVLVPPLESQKRFSTSIEAINRVKAAHTSALAELDTLVTSLQASSFSGSHSA